MTIGVDSSVLVAAIHAAHPRHALAVGWVTRALQAHTLVATHHSELEAYAVLTRLPGDNRVTPSEARDLLTASVKENMAIAGFDPDSLWEAIGSFVTASVAGGRSYDAHGMRVIDPSDPSEGNA